MQSTLPGSFNQSQFCSWTIIYSYQNKWGICSRANFLINLLNAVIILHTSSATRHHFQLRRTKIISVAFGCIFAQQVAEAADSSLFLFEDYLLQLFKTKRTADWTNKGCSGSITRFTVSFQYGTVVNAVCALWQASKTVPTDSLALSRSKILKTTTDSDSSARLTV